MKKIAKFESAIGNLMALFLALMGILVFSNVVLRYFFNSGLTWAEEMSRFLFVWVVFLGAIGALKDNNHLGFSTLVQALPPVLKKLCYLVSNILMMLCLWALFEGSLNMTLLTTDNLSPSMGVPLAFMYGIGIITSVGMFLIICCNLYRALFVKGAVDKLVVMKESEDEIALETELAKGEVKP
jgi:TRAP-type C4-dicarboxylate transport system permease small subunit